MLRFPQDLLKAWFVPAQFIKWADLGYGPWRALVGPGPVFLESGWAWKSPSLAHKLIIDLCSYWLSDLNPGAATVAQAPCH